MRTLYVFIKKNCGDLITFSYIISLSAMISLAWLLSIPEIFRSGYCHTNNLIKNYDLILIYFISMLFLLQIGSHLKEEIRTGKINLIRSKYGDGSVFILYAVSYLMFFFLFNIVPVYAAACIQQSINIIPGINYIYITISAFSFLFGYGVIWVLLLICLTLLRYGETKIILVSYSLAFFFSLADFRVGIKIFNMSWINGFYLNGFKLDTLFSLSAWFILFISEIILLKIISTNYNRIKKQVNKQRRKFINPLHWLKLDLYNYHLKMLGLKTQKILILFLSTGAAVIYLLLKIKGADFYTLSKIFLGGILPVAFSFNLQQIIDVDREAGTLNCILLKKKAYYKIILNRWTILLVPQIFILTVYFILFYWDSYFFNPVLFIYLIELNILGSILNISVHLFTGKNGIAKIFVLLFFYFSLRSDIQNICSTNAIIKGFNIFYPLTHNNNILPTYYQQGFLILLILMSLTFVIRILRGKYNAINL